MSEIRKAAEMALEALEKDPVPLNAINNAQMWLRQALAQPKQKYDYRVKYDRPCYKCRSNFCPGNCKEPKYLTQPEQRPVGTYEGVMETMLSLRKGTLEQQQIYTHMKDKLLYTAPPSLEAAVLAEREACAKVCEEIGEEFPFEPHEPDPVLPAYCAEAIRARGKK